MKTRLENFLISSKIVAQGVAFPFEKNGEETHNKHRVTVLNLGSGAKVGFDFYGSTRDYFDGKKEMLELDLLHAFDCLLSDSVSGSDSFENFCSEMGYDPDSISHLRIYKECKKQFVKLEKLGISIDEAYDLMNLISEMA